MPRACRQCCDIGPVLLSGRPRPLPHPPSPTPTGDEKHCSNTGPWEWARAAQNAGGVENEI